MSGENKSLDLLGIKGISDAVRIATERFIDGAAAFLARVCLPAAEELGLALKDRVSAWRAKNAVRMLSTANDMLLAQQPDTHDQIHPRLVHVAIEEASWTDEDAVQRMWAGLLASATSPGGQSDENLIFMNILRQLSSLQVRILNYAVETAPKYAGQRGLPIPGRLRVPTENLSALFAVDDLQRLDRELDHLRELGLIGFGQGGGIDAEGDETDLTPTPLALHLYVRSQGSKLSAVDFWTLKPRRESVNDKTG